MKINRIIAFGLVLPTVLLAGVFPAKRIMLRSINKQKVAKLEADWGKLTYSPIGKTTNFLQQVREEIGRQAESSKKLDRAQTDDLITTISAFLLAYNVKDYEQYKAFRLPAGSDLRSELNKAKAEWVLGKTQAGLSKETNTPVTLASVRPQELLREYYMNSLSATNANGKPMYCMDCWKGIAFETMQIRINRFTNQIGSIASVMWNEHELTGAAYPPTVNFLPAPESLRTNYGGLTSAYFSCVLQTDTSITNHRAYFHCYWDPEARHWMPLEFRGAFAARAIGFVF